MGTISVEALVELQPLLELDGAAAASISASSSVRNVDRGCRLRSSMAGRYFDWVMAACGGKEDRALQTCARAGLGGARPPALARLIDNYQSVNFDELVDGAPQPAARMCSFPPHTRMIP